MPQQSTFSIYASNFLNRSYLPQSSPSPPSPPLFYSVTEGSHLGEEDDLFRGGNDEIRGSVNTEDFSDVDEDGQPRLKGSMGGSRREVVFDALEEDEGLGGYYVDRNHEEAVIDPYLDEQDLEDVPGIGADSIPLIASLGSSSTVAPPLAAPRPQSHGWLSHLQQSHIPPVIRHPSPPPLSPLSPSSSDASLPPDYLQQSSIPPPPPTRINLEESLLPRDGVERSVFSLPDPNRPIPIRKYHDASWTAVWCSCLLLCAIGSVLALFLTNVQSLKYTNRILLLTALILQTSPKPPTNQPSAPPPYKTLTRQIPFLVTLTLFSSALSYAYLFFLRLAVRPMLILTALSVPVSLIFAAIWAFAGSFFWEEGVEGTWGETVGYVMLSNLTQISNLFCN